MFDQSRNTSPQTAAAVAELLYKSYSNGAVALERLADAYIAETQEADRRWEEANSEFAHPWGEDTYSYTIPQGRAEDALSEIRQVLGVRGTWNLGTWGEGVTQFAARLAGERVANSIGEGI